MKVIFALVVLQYVLMFVRATPALARTKNEFSDHPVPHEHNPSKPIHQIRCSIEVDENGKIKSQRLEIIDPSQIRNKREVKGQNIHLEVSSPDHSPPDEPIISNAIDNGEKFIQLDTATGFELIVGWPNIPSNIDSYKLKLCVAAQDLEGNLFPVTTSCFDRTLNVVNEAYQIKDLYPDTYYLVSLRAHSSMGDGPVSEKFFKTSNEDPKKNTK